MNIREFSDYLLKLYEDMSLTFSTYQNSVGLQCPPDCGKCCLKPDIEATVFEMIPMALKILDEGRVDEYLERLDQLNDGICINFIPLATDGKGRCGQYAERPSVCRMFGVAGFLNKRREITLSICKHLKNMYPQEVNPEGAPILSFWSSQMATLDPRLVQDFLPLNQALKIALEKVVLYAEYQKYHTEN
jgi:Fe-S-cluster containining protein